MGHQVTIIDNIPHITPVKSRVEAIVKLDSPKSPKNCKQFLWNGELLINVFEGLTDQIDSNISPD